MPYEGLVGRTYLEHLVKHKNLLAGVIILGNKEEKPPKDYMLRTQGRWTAESMENLLSDNAVPYWDINELNTKSTANLIKELNIDVIIQGGVGIIKDEVLNSPAIGFLNIHPGKLPEYRGCSVPEWAMLNDEPIYATAHLIDNGIDTGPIICMKKMNINDDWDYYDIRSNVYNHCGSTMIYALNIIVENENDLEKILKKQDEKKSKYWEPMKDTALLKTVIDKF